jgi:parallel beta-helix repeat protein
MMRSISTVCRNQRLARGCGKVVWLALAALLLAAQAMGASLLVPGTYATIQLAVNAAAASGDEVHVTSAGSYAGFAITGKDLAVYGDVSGVNITSQIDVYGATSATLQNLTVDTTGYGIIVQNSTTNCTVRNCTITGCNYYGLYVAWGATCYVYNSTMNSNGTASGYAGVHVVQANTTLWMEDCTANSNTSFGLFAHSTASPCSMTLKRCSFNSNTQAGVRLDAADQVLNAEDCYFNSNTLFGIWAYGNAIVNLTRCKGQLNGQDGVYVDTAPTNFVLTANDCDLTTNSRCGLCNFGKSTIALGGSRLNGNTLDGVLCDQNASAGSSFTLTLCDLKSNGRDGGIFARYCDVLATQCSFSNNTSIGFERNYNNSLAGASTVMLRQCTVSGNGSKGALIQTDLAGSGITFEITNSTFAGNTGGEALMVNSDPGPISGTIDRSIFRDGTNNNSGLRTLYLRQSGTVVMNNSIVDEGYAGVRLEGGTSKLYHCTFASRSGVCEEGVQAIWSPTSNHEFKNGIIDGFKNGLKGYNGTNVINSNNCIRTTVANFAGDVTAGTNSLLGINPVFVTATSGVGTGNFHLQSSSPCVGTRANAPDLGLTSDLAGSARPSPAATPPDLGAYESTEVPVSVSAFAVE